MAHRKDINAVISIKDLSLIRNNIYVSNFRKGRIAFKGIVLFALESVRQEPAHISILTHGSSIINYR